jgi:uncharacterized protein (UPF0332 family)
MNQVEFPFQKARENIEIAGILLIDGYYDVVASRAYYAMFYVAKALLFSKGLSFSSHSAMIGAFGKEFSKTGVIDQLHHRHLMDAFEARQLGDYGILINVSEEKAVQVLEWAGQFVRVGREYLQQKDNPL